jgi:zeaxanthin glucosyltransferase
MQVRHFGVISPPVSGHIHPMSALARELQSRGHLVTWFHVHDLEARIRSAGFDFCPLGLSDHPPGSLTRSFEQLGQLDGMAAVRFTIQAVARTSEMFCREGPEAIRKANVEALLVDQMEPAGGTIADHLRIPFITVCNALAINRDPAVPPPFTPWRYREQLGFVSRLRNRIGYALGDITTKPITRVVAKYRQAWKLPPLATPDDSFSRLAQICQMPRELDYPRTTLPVSFHYVGPLREASETTPFPWDRLDGRRVVYASLGTLQNRRPELLRTVAAACIGTDVQLVISHGGGLSDAQADSLPGSPIVVPYAPQRAVIARASLTITHAGLNTVLDSLAAGVPLITIPITYEQPAIARRVERTGAGAAIAFASLREEVLRDLVLKVLNSPEYHNAAQRMAACIASAGGVSRAADIVLTAL